MRVLVTGGAGFIGSNLCRRLSEEPSVTTVRVIDDLSTGHRSSLGTLPVEFSESTILDRDALRRSASGCDAIVHLAALGSVPRSVKNPHGTHAANATGSLNVLEAAREEGAHVILASSSSVYGANPAMPKVETLQCMPSSPYAVSKLAAEQYAMAFAQCYGLSVLPLRFFNVFGPGQMPGHVYAAVIPVFMEAVLQGRAVPVNGDGSQSRDFTYVGTVVETIVQALTGRVTGSPTNLAFGTRTSLLQLVQLISEVLDKDVEVSLRPPRPGDVLHSQASQALLRLRFPGVVPVSLRAGLVTTGAWMRTHLEATT